MAQTKPSTSRAHAAETKGARRLSAAARPDSPRSRDAINNPTSLESRYDPNLDSDNVILPTDVELDLGDIIAGDMTSIRTSGNTLKFVVDEKFMQDLLAISVSPGNEQDNPYAVVIVNNRTYEIPRGRTCRVPRFVVEALAHAKQSDYKTHRSLPGDPKHMRPIENVRFSYPFIVKKDPAGAKGAQWLTKVMNDPS